MIINNLIKYIKSITINSVEIKSTGDNIKLVNSLNKFSSTKIPTLKIKINDDIVNRNDKLSYECPNCHKINNIGVGRFLSKKSENCPKCKEQSDEKRQRQSNYMKDTYNKFNKVISTKKDKDNSLEHLIKKSVDLFEEESYDFKNNYFKRVPTKDEFLKILPNVKSISKIPINKDIIYYPIVKNTNQMRYSPKVLLNNKLYLLSEFEYYCEICGDDFSGRNFKNRSKKVLCNGCSFSNEVFKFKSYLNINGDKVVYQSNPELKLIKYCNNNNLLIKNGPKINYNFDNSDKIYKVDFEIPKLMLLIEIKDNHIWHKEQVESGKWSAKEKAAINWCDLNNYKYHLIFDVDKLINEILTMNERILSFKLFNQRKRSMPYNQWMKRIVKANESLIAPRQPDKFNEGFELLNNRNLDNFCKDVFNEFNVSIGSKYISISSKLYDTFFRWDDIKNSFNNFLILLIDKYGLTPTKNVKSKDFGKLLSVHLYSSNGYERIYSVNDCINDEVSVKFFIEEIRIKW